MSKPSDGAVKAGRALAAMKDNPELEELVRVASLDVWQTIDEARRRELKSRAGDPNNASGRAVKAMLATWAQEIQRLGLPAPQSINEWAQLVRVVERDPKQLRFVEVVHAVKEWIEIEQAREAFRNRHLGDSRDDTAKKKKKRKRLLNSKAQECAKQYRREKRTEPEITMREVVQQYVEENGGSVESIIRTLNDNPEAWK